MLPNTKKHKNYLYPRFSIKIKYNNTLGLKTPNKHTQHMLTINTIIKYHSNITTEKFTKTWSR